MSMYLLPGAAEAHADIRAVRNFQFSDVSIGIAKMQRGDSGRGGHQRGFLSQPTKWILEQCRYLYVDGKTIHDHNNVVEEELSVEALAVMLVRGEFPENYDQIIREMSDDDFERLWEIFEEKRKQ